MRDGLAADLARWERGELGVDEIAARHTDSDAAALAEMHAVVSYLVSEPARRAGPSWEALATRLADHEPEPVSLAAAARRRRLPVRGAVAAFLAGAVMAPATAAAHKADATRRVTEGIGVRVAELLVVDPPAAASPTADEQTAPPATAGSASLVAVSVSVPVVDVPVVTTVPPSVDAPAPSPSVPPAGVVAPVGGPVEPVERPDPTSPPPASPPPVEPAPGDGADEVAAPAPVESTTVKGGPAHGNGHDKGGARAGKSADAPGHGGKDAPGRAGKGHGRGNPSAQA